MNANEFSTLAKTNGWNRKTTRNELYKLNDPELWAQRDAILVGLGFAATQEPVLAPAPVTAPVVRAAVPARRGNMILKFPAKDVLTGKQLEAGADVTGVKLGGGWDFTAEPISVAEFRKLREAMLFSLDDDAENILDHHDYDRLAEYGAQYPEVAAMIGCSVPGLND